jgi:hypothetical protein
MELPERLEGNGVCWAAGSRCHSLWRRSSSRSHSPPARKQASNWVSRTAGLTNPPFSHMRDLRTRQRKPSTETGSAFRLLGTGGASDTPRRLQCFRPWRPQYAWGALDDAVRSAAGQHLRILLNLLDAPTWAEGPGRPSNSNIGPGAWDPSPTAFAQFVHAVASRYSGQFAELPRVSYWELCNEENLSTSLLPIWWGSIEGF